MTPNSDAANPKLQSVPDTQVPRDPGARIGLWVLLLTMAVLASGVLRDLALALFR